MCSVQSHALWGKSCGVYGLVPVLVAASVSQLEKRSGNKQQLTWLQVRNCLFWAGTCLQCGLLETAFWLGNLEHDGA